MNNKGFTLVELLATIIILGVVVGIAGFSITTIIKNAKEKDLEILVDNIKSASETYYQECKYSKVDLVDCNLVSGAYEVKLGDLVTYGYLAGNSEEVSSTKTLINPVDNTAIDSCVVAISFNAGEIQVIAKTASSSTRNCPTNY